MPSSVITDSAYVALGANLASLHGDPAATLKSALDDLASLSTVPLQVSPFYKSDPKDCPADSPVYINAVARLVPAAQENALSFLQKLQNIETQFGRLRSGIRNEARVLDLDLLSFRNEASATAVLTLPHPRAHERRFVLEPWITLAGREWPLHRRTLAEWLAECTDPPLRPLQE